MRQRSVLSRADDAPDTDPVTPPVETVRSEAKLGTHYVCLFITLVVLTIVVLCIAIACLVELRHITTAIDQFVANGTAVDVDESVMDTFRKRVYTP